MAWLLYYYDVSIVVCFIFAVLLPSKTVKPGLENIAASATLAVLLGWAVWPLAIIAYYKHQKELTSKEKRNEPCK